MANHRQPTLRLHKSGQYITEWNNTTHYLGEDLDKARTAYANSLVNWAKWRANKSLAIAVEKPPADRPVAVMLDEWLAHLHTTVGLDAERYYRRSTNRLRTAFGIIPLSAFNHTQILAVQADALNAGYAPRTINHETKAAKRFAEWCEDMGYMPPIRARTLKSIALPPVKPKAKPAAFVAEYIAKVARNDPRLEPVLMLQYLAGLRPREAFRLMLGEYTWHRPELGKFVAVTKNKTGKTTRRERYVVLSKAAAAWLAKSQPYWTNQSSLKGAITRAGGDLGCHFLRHSAWSHLRAAGVTLEETKLLLGHNIEGAWVSYEETPWHTYRPRMEKLKLPSSPRTSPPLPPARQLILDRLAAKAATKPSSRSG